MSKSVTKSDLINSVAEAAGLKKVEAERAVSAFTGAIEKALVDESKVTLVGFGTFSVSHRAARQGRNPRTKEVIQIPASKTVKFKVGKAIKDSLNT